MKKALAFLMVIVFSIFFVSCGEIEMTATPIEVKGKVTNELELNNYLSSIFDYENTEILEDTGYKLTVIVNEKITGNDQSTESAYNLSGRLDYSAIPFYTAGELKILGGRVTNSFKGVEKVNLDADLLYYRGNTFYKGEVRKVSLLDENVSEIFAFKSLISPDLLKYLDDDHVFSLITSQNYGNIISLVKGGTLYSSDRGFMGKKVLPDGSYESLVYCKLEKGTLQFDEFSIYLKTVESESGFTTTRTIKIEVESTSYSSDYELPNDYYDYVKEEIEL